MEQRGPRDSQQATLRALGEEGQRKLVRSLVEAWEHHDVDGLVSLLAEDARFTMPPLPAWFDGRGAVRDFFEERMFEHAWRVLAMTANGQLTLACYMGDGLGDRLHLSAVNVVTLRGRQVVALDGFLAHGVQQPFGLAGHWAIGRPPGHSGAGVQVGAPSSVRVDEGRTAP